MKTSVLLLTIGAAFVTANWPVNGTNGGYENGGYQEPDHYETVTTTVLTTYCPEATVFAHNGVDYTVTEATTLTITDCPCTIVRVCLFLPVLIPPSPA